MADHRLAEVGVGQAGRAPQGAGAGHVAAVGGGAGKRSSGIGTSKDVRRRGRPGLCARGPGQPTGRAGRPRQGVAVPTRLNLVARDARWSRCARRRADAGTRRGDGGPDSRAARYCDPVIRHVVAWTIKWRVRRGPPRETRRSCRAALAGLPPKVPQIRRCRWGVDLGEADGNWDVVLVVDVDSREDLEGYIAHPAHVEVAGLIASLRTPADVRRPRA